MKDDLKKLTAAEAISKIASVSDVEELEELADSESRKTVLKAIESRFDELAEEELQRGVDEILEEAYPEEVEPEEEEPEEVEEPEPVAAPTKTVVKAIVVSVKKVPYNKTDSRLGFGRVSIKPNETIDVNQIPEAMFAFWEEIGAVGYRDEPV